MIIQLPFPTASFDTKGGLGEPTIIRDLDSVTMVWVQSLHHISYVSDHTRSDLSSLHSLAPLLTLSTSPELYWTNTP